MILENAGWGAELVPVVAIAWGLIIPAALSALSSLTQHKSQQKQADAAVSPAEAQCESENQRRKAMGAAVAQSRGWDVNSPMLQALIAPRPCPKSGKGEGGGYGFMSDLLGGGAMLAGSALNKPTIPGSTSMMGMGTPGIGGTPCPPGTIKHPITGECANPSDMFPGE